MAGGGWGSFVAVEADDETRTGGDAFVFSSAASVPISVAGVFFGIAKAEDCSSGLSGATASDRAPPNSRVRSGELDIIRSGEPKEPAAETAPPWVSFKGSSPMDAEDRLRTPNK